MWVNRRKIAAFGGKYRMCEIAPVNARTLLGYAGILTEKS
jgi:hypothetical protein